MKPILLIVAIVIAYFNRDKLADLFGADTPVSTPPQSPKPRPFQPGGTAQDVEFYQHGPTVEAMAVQPHYEHQEVYDVTPDKPRVGEEILCTPECSRHVDWVQPFKPY